MIRYWSLVDQTPGKYRASQVSYIGPFSIIFGPYLPALLCLSTPRFTRLSLPYSIGCRSLSDLMTQAYLIRSLLSTPCLTLWTTCVGRLRVELRSTVYQTIALTVVLPPIARGCSASCSKVLFHTGLPQSIAPIREFSFCNAHSQTSV